MHESVTDYHKHTDAEKLTFLINLVLDGAVVTESDWRRFHQKLLQLSPRMRTDFWLGLRSVVSEQEYAYAHSFYVRECLHHGWSR
jgi:hypothetical protein